jgi:large subunit ribosomal protein L6
MSRVGKQPISVPTQVTIKVADDRSILVEGPKGKLTWKLPEGVKLEQERYRSHHHS